jgi:ribosomal protein S12 methylthiotransferase accessory factor
MTCEASRPLAEVHGELRFAPNFSVYVLPPDEVCLYSEDRKLFLHGALYCALAERIGAGEPRESIVRALSAEFPNGQIEEAFKRLTDRRILTSAVVADNTATGFWASLGLRPEVAAENLAGVNVAVTSLDAAGAAELTQALQDFGVRVVEQQADFTIALVEDYLDGRLADFNRAQLEKKAEWVLAQPAGLFPLVGPIFTPGKSACWNCIADRMKWNRQVRAFLDRKGARSVAVSPLRGNLLGSAGIGLAAAEIAKAIASGFRTDLCDHIVNLDMMGSAVQRHYAPMRPQCQVCGNPALRDPGRVAAPIRLRAGGRMVVTSGGYRAVAPGETVSRYRKHVSPLTGVVSHLERIHSGQPLDASFIARHNFSPCPETVEALELGLTGDSYGKGSSAEQGEASALMEAIERYCGIFQGDEIRITRRFSEFPDGDAIHPNAILNYSDAQLLRADEGHDCSGDGVPFRFDPSGETEWTPVWSLCDERFKYIPTGLLYFFHESDSVNKFAADSNGCAAGNTLEEAILQGFLELVERDAYAIWWYNKLRLPEVDLDEIADSYVRDLQREFAARDRNLWALDATSDLGIPVIVAVAHWTQDGREHIEVAAGAHFDIRIAVLRATTELNQFIAISQMRTRWGETIAEGDDDYGTEPLPLRKYPYLRPKGKASLDRRLFENFEQLDRREQVLACVRFAKKHGLEVLVLDQTRPDVGVPVVRVIVPGLRHFHRRFGPGRLYDVPVKLGHRKRPIREADVNPLHPRT